VAKSVILLCFVLLCFSSLGWAIDFTQPSLVWSAPLVPHFQLCPDGSLIFCEAKEWPGLWRVSPNLIDREIITRLPYPLFEILFSPQGNWAILDEKGLNYAYLDLATKNRLPWPTSYCQNLAISPDGKRVAYQHNDYDTTNYLAVASPTGQNEKVICPLSVYTESVEIIWLSDKSFAIQGRLTEIGGVPISIVNVEDGSIGYLLPQNESASLYGVVKNLLFFLRYHPIKGEAGYLTLASINLVTRQLKDYGRDCASEPPDTKILDNPLRVITERYQRELEPSRIGEDLEVESYGLWLFNLETGQSRELAKLPVSFSPSQPEVDLLRGRIYFLTPYNFLYYISFSP
jgi:hypothetical protein